MRRRLSVLWAVVVAAICLAAVVARAEVPPLDRALYQCHAAAAQNTVAPPPPVWQTRGDRPPDAAVVAGERPSAEPCPAGQVALPKVTGPGQPPVALPPRAILGAPPVVSPVGAYAPYYYAGDGWGLTGTRYAGMDTAIQVGLPTIRPGSHSLGQIAVIEDTTVARTIELGWNVDPGLYNGSTLPHLFLYVNKDHYATNGLLGGDCYNCDFVPLAGAPYHLGQVLQRAGAPSDFSLVYKNGNWWAGFNGAWIGYAPSSFWGGTFQGGTWLPAFGEVYDASGPNSQMGNGRVGSDSKALAMSNPGLFLTPNSLQPMSGHPLQSGPNQNPFPSNLPNYGVGTYATNARTWRYGGT